MCVGIGSSLSCCDGRSVRPNAATRHSTQPPHICTYGCAGGPAGRRGTGGRPSSWLYRVRRETPLSTVTSPLPHHADRPRDCHLLAHHGSQAHPHTDLVCLPPGALRVSHTHTAAQPTLKFIATGLQSPTRSRFSSGTTRSVCSITMYVFVCNTLFPEHVGMDAGLPAVLCVL